MIGHLVRIDASEEAILDRDPEKVFGRLIGDSLPETVHSTTFFGKLFGRKSTHHRHVPPTIGADRTFDFDKTWSGIHYLLTGTAFEGEFPANFIAAGGTPVSDIEVGYGPAKRFSREEVARIRQFLEGVSVDDLRRRYDPAKMKSLGIYPDVWVAEGDGGFQWLESYFEAAKEFVLATDPSRYGLLVYVD
jgi:hypothetical protein